MMFRLLFIIAAIGLVGCDVVYSYLDKDGAEEKQIIGDVRPFEANEAVSDAQELLEFYGYDPGRIDGVLGPSTRSAIARFQRENNVEESRYLNKVTWEKLHIFEGSGLIREGQMDVAVIQKVLLKAGFSPGKVDGNLGQKTLEAIKDFQKANGLYVDGKVGYQTLTKFWSYLPVE